MTEIFDEQLRAGGFTADARNYPRSRRQLEMIAAWNNCTVEQLPPAAHFFPNAHMRDTWERVERAAQLYHNFNPPTIYVGLVWVGDELQGGLLVGRRALPGFGHGKWALIGGFQDMGEDWRTCLTREHKEEVGIDLDPSRWTTWGDPVSVENNSRNLQFCAYKLVYPDTPRKVARNDISLSGFVPNNEISEIKVWDGYRDSIDWAFPAHEEIAQRYFSNILR